jgi:DNA polymerase III subunit epsilon
MLDFTILDFETTGLDPHIDFVTEIGAVRVINGREVGRFATFVNFGGVLPEKIKQLTGITQEDINAGMPPRTAFAILRNLMGSSTVVAHNAAFDMGFLIREVSRLGGKEVENDFICTKTVAASLLPELGNYSLKHLCDYYQILPLAAHRALADCHTTQKVLEYLLGEGDVESFVNVAGHPKQWSPPKRDFLPKHATVLAY